MAESTQAKPRIVNEKVYDLILVFFQNVSYQREWTTSELT